MYLARSFLVNFDNSWGVRTDGSTSFAGMSGNKMGEGELGSEAVLSLVGIGKEICLITVGLTEANVATVLAGWLSK